MKNIVHSQIVVSTDIHILAMDVKWKADLVFKRGSVSEILGSPSNKHFSILIDPPRDSDGMEESYYFIEWLKELINPDGSPSIKFVDFFYRNNNSQSEIIESN